MQRRVVSIIVLIFFIAIFIQWITSLRTISSGDWPYFYQKASQSFSFIPVYYKAYWGFGETKVIFTALETYFQWTAKAVSYIAPWEISERVFWFFPFLFLSFFSAKKFTKSVLGGLIYTTNTYILMVVSGGQMGVALSYAVAPLVIHAWNNLVESSGGLILHRVRSALVVGLLFSLQIFFDPRIAALSLSIAILYYFYQFFVMPRSVIFWIRKSVFSFIIPFFTAFLLHALWILPMLIYRVGPSDHDNQRNYSQGMLDFFSFSDFSHMFSLLHPNWPENIFGKVYFLQPEFLLIPILVFSILLIKKGKHSLEERNDSRKVLFFLLLGLLGAFLAKGVNEPFGALYTILFTYVPGFVIFRDPTKFMILIALSYAYLIPQALLFFSQTTEAFLSKKGKRAASSLLYTVIAVVFILLWAVFDRQALFGGLGRGLSAHEVPESYRSFAAFLANDASFSRVLWIPTHQRFGYYGNDHPAVSATEFFQTSDTKKIINLLKKPETLLLLRESAVRYVVVPFDSQGEIFLSDRKYDEKKFKSLTNEMKKINGIKKIASFGATDVYEIPEVREHFWMSSSSKALVDWVQESPTHYTVIADGHNGDTIVFAERFSRFWRVKDRGTVQSLSHYKGILIQYQLQRDGVSRLEFYHIFTRAVFVGSVISLITLLSVAIFLIVTRRRT